MRTVAALLVAILVSLPLSAATTVSYDAGPADAWITLSTAADGSNTPEAETGAGADVEDRGRTQASYSTSEGAGGGGGNNGGGSPPPDPPAHDPLSLVDKIEPDNNNCHTPEAWPVSGNSMTSSGVFNSTDPGDWSSVGVLRTETLQGTPVKAKVSTFKADSHCTAPGTDVEAEADADYLLHATPVGAVLYGQPVQYGLTYTILPNDAGQHRDLGTDASTAHRLEVFVNGPETPVFGGLPNRDLKGDQDGYLIDVPVPLTIQSGSPVVPAALVTVHFRTACSVPGAAGALQLFDLNGGALLPWEDSCTTPVHQSCVALGHTTVMAKVFTPNPGGSPRRGTSYNVSATASPIGILWADPNNAGPYATYAADAAAAGRLDDARSGSSSVVDISTFEASAPWCSSTAPALLSALTGTWRAIEEAPLPNDLFGGGGDGDLPPLPARIEAYVRTFLP